MNPKSDKEKIRIKVKKDIQSILDSASSITTKIEEKTAWDADKLDKITFELIYNLNFTPVVEDYIKDSAIWDSLNKCASNDKFDAKFFIRALIKYLEDFNNRSRNSYIGICQLNCRPNVNIQAKLKSFTGTVEFRTGLKQTIVNSVKNMSNSDRLLLGLQDDFVYATVRFDANNDRSAAEDAYRIIKYAFGVLKIVYHGHGVSKRFGIPNAPMGKFLSASTTFAFNNSSREMGAYFSENHFPIAHKQSFSVWQKFEENGTKITDRYAQRLKVIDFSEKIVQTIILFQEGLEATAIDVALLKLWTGIELLCSRNEREVSEKTIERASSIFTNHQYIAMRLRFIQEFRNKIVHKGFSGDHALLCAQWASIILSEIIVFSLFNKYDLKKHEDILDYMSIPSDESKINKIIKSHKQKLSSIRRPITYPD